MESFKMSINIPSVGCGFRGKVKQAILNNLESFDILEVMVDHYLAGSDNSREIFQKISQQLPIVLHSVALSVGTAAQIDTEYINIVNRTIKDLNALVYSEHLSFTKVDGIDTRLLLPLPRTSAAAEVAIKNVKSVKENIEVPFCLENISYYFTHPESQYSEVEFLNLVCQESGADILLDIENLRINSINHHYDPYKYIDQLLPNRVQYIHVAGGITTAELELDTHDQKLSQTVFDLLKYTLKKQNPKYIILERDGRFNDFLEVIDDCHLIHEIIRRGHHEQKLERITKPIN